MSFSVLSLSQSNNAHLPTTHYDELHQDGQ